MICIIMVFLMNRKYNLDIKQKKVYIITSKVNSKYEEISHEPGSGAMYIPILGHLFPKLWDQKMKAIQVYYLNINNFRYEVNEELYNSVEEGDFVKMYYGKNSNYLLEIKKK